MPNVLDIPDVERFAGALDCHDKRVLIVGSGVIAVTLVPEPASVAAHVTMLQRSPTHVTPRPSRDRAAT